MRKKILPICMILLLILGGCGASQSSAPSPAAPAESAAGSNSSSDPYDLRWGTAAAGGAFQVIGSAMLEDAKAANPNITGSTMPSTPTTSVMGIHEGKMNIAFSIADITNMAKKGEGDFAAVGKIDDIREVAALYPQAAHIVTLEGSGINSIEDLRGKRVTPGPKSTSGDVEFQRTIALYGMTVEDVNIQYLSFEEAGQQMIDGHLDAVFLFSPPPFAPVINIASQKSIKMLEIPAEQIAELTELEGLDAYEFAAGTYKGVDYPVQTISSRSHIIAHKDVPEDIVYSLVKSFHENFGRYPTVLSNMGLISAENMADDIGIELHPGAAKYYREQGWIQ